MITFKKVRYRNLLSTGNQFTEVQLNRAPTTLIVGANGSGKCVRANSRVLVRAKDPETEAKLLAFLAKC